MAVHSAKLVSADISGTSPGLRYTVPTGYRTIIKSIVCSNHNAAANRLKVAIFVGATQKAYLQIFCAAVDTVGETQIQECWIVLNETDSVKMSVVADGIWTIMSGTELLL